MKKNKIFIAGHNGMVGSAIFRRLAENISNEIIFSNKLDLDLCDQSKVYNFLKEIKPDEVYIAAAKVGGVHANNTLPADFIFQNLSIACNLIHGSYLAGTKKILYLGSSCIYPTNVSQPMKESSLLGGYLEPTNEPYAIAKIAGIKLCESYNRQHGKNNMVDFRSVIPASLFGPGDNYHSENSHVIPAMIKRFHEAKLNNLKNVTIWGTGLPRREFLYVDDMADAAINIMNLDLKEYSKLTSSMVSHINIGNGSDISIGELAKMIARTVGYNGELVYDEKKPDGVYQKLLDSSKISSIGWKPSIGLDQGLLMAYNDFLKNRSSLRMK